MINVIIWSHWIFHSYQSNNFSLRASSSKGLSVVMSACLSLLYASTELDCLFRQSCRILQADVVVEEDASLKYFCISWDFIFKPLIAKSRRSSFEVNLFARFTNFLSVSPP